MIAQAITNLNDELAVGDHIVAAPSTELFGVGSKVDSLGLVSLLVDVETAASERMGRTVVLTDDRAMSRDPLPFATVQDLMNYIVELSAE